MTAGMTRRRGVTLAAWLTAAICLGVADPRPAAAQSTPQVEMFRALSDDLVEELLAGLKLKAERLDDLDKKFRQWQFTLEGHEVTLLVSNKSDFQLYASFDDEETFRHVNQWNRDRRWAKAYIEEGETSVALEMDVDFAPGISRAQFTAYVKLYGDMLKEFRKFLAEQ